MKIYLGTNHAFEFLKLRLKPKLSADHEPTSLIKGKLSLINLTIYSIGHILEENI